MQQIKRGTSTEPVRVRTFGMSFGVITKLVFFSICVERNFSRWVNAITQDFTFFADAHVGSVLIGGPLRFRGIHFYEFSVSTMTATKVEERHKTILIQSEISVWNRAG